MKSASKHLGFLDEIRGTAIIVVFLYHCLAIAFGEGQLPWGTWFRSFNVTRPFLALTPLTFGWAGVAVFFVVSGFCIHLSYRRSPVWGDFGIRRLFRIYPPYALTAVVFAMLLPWKWTGWAEFGAADLTSHLLLVHNFDNRFHYGCINPALWSIAVEAQLYLLYPLLLKLVNRWGWRGALILTGTLELLLRGYSGYVLTTTGEPPPLWFAGLPFLYWFSWSIGAALAEAYLGNRISPLPKNTTMILAVVAVGSCFFKPASSFSFLLFSLLTASVMLGRLRSEEKAVDRPLLRRWLAVIGQWSYSIYLLHMPLLTLAPRLASKLPMDARAQSIVVFVIAVGLWLPIMGVSALSYRWVELTSIDIGKRVSRKLGLI